MNNIKKVNEFTNKKPLNKYVSKIIIVLLYPIYIIGCIPISFYKIVDTTKSKIAYKIASNDKKISDIVFKYYYDMARWYFKTFSSNEYKSQYRAMENWNESYSSSCNLLSDCINKVYSYDMNRKINKYIENRFNNIEEYDDYSYRIINMTTPKLEEAGFIVTKLANEKGYEIKAIKKLI